MEIRRALISVSRKINLFDFAMILNKQYGVEIVSTGGTSAFLRRGDLIKVREIEDFTRFPEIMEGRLKTLHPMVHGGLLGRRDTHADVMQKHGIQPIDLLVVNLYPFEETVTKPDCDLETAIEQIDIGGPAMLRSAAKNYKWVAPVVDIDDYPRILDEMNENNGNLTERLRFELAAKVFDHTARYDRAIADYLATQKQ